MRVLLIVLLALTACYAGGPPTVIGRDFRVQVKHGETLSDVARRYGLAIDQLMFANHLRQIQLKPGQKLVIPSRRIVPARHPADGLVVNLPERGLYLFRHNQFVHFYPIAIGSPQTPTPVGHFKIVIMQKNPTWLPPAAMDLGEMVVPPGPDNPLGDRWIGLSAPGIGIHGTNTPYWVGADVSHGCLRMFNTLVQQLYSQVKVGMPVWIEYHLVRIGQDASGQTWMQAFPDAYHRGDAETQKLLQTQQVKAIIRNATGRAVLLSAEASPTPTATKP